MAKRNNQAQVVEHKQDNVPSPVITSSTSFDVDPAHNLKTFRNLIIFCAQVGTTQAKQDGSISQRMMELARPHQSKEFIRDTDGTRDDRASVKFLSLLKDEESFIKSAEAGNNRVETLPRCWTQAKSNIKAALEYGINLADYASESALRKAVIKARGQRKQNPIKESMDSVTKRMIEELPQDRALDLIHQLEAALEAALQELVPNEPVKKDAKAA